MATDARTRAEQEIDAAWEFISHCYDIEDRAYFEREAPRNGFKWPLVQAIHHMWKREPKVAELEEQIHDLLAHGEADANRIAALEDRLRFWGLDDAPVGCSKFTQANERIAALEREVDLIRKAAGDASLSDGAVRCIAAGTQPPTADDIAWATDVAQAEQDRDALKERIAALEQQIARAFELETMHGADCRPYLLQHTQGERDRAVDRWHKAEQDRDALRAAVERMQDALMKVEWVKRTHGSVIVCAFCGQTPIEHGGNDHAEGCEWWKLVSWRLEDALLSGSHPTPAPTQE